MNNRRACLTCGAALDDDHDTACWFVGRVRDRHTDHVVVPRHERDERLALVSELKSENAQLRRQLEERGR